MKLALLQLNPTIGDISGNAEKITIAVKRIAQEKPDLIISSELSLLGYPPRDLLLNKTFVDASWEILRTMARELTDAPPVLIGLAEHNSSSTGRPLFNIAALIKDGRIHQIFRKTLLPTYDVFDEDRYFEPAQGPQILRLHNWIFGISICEDIWNDRDYWNLRRYHTDPIEELVKSGAQWVINISASPFTVGKQKVREDMLSSSAQKYSIPVVYVNQVGGNDDLVFDGRSCVFDASGKLIAQAAAFQEDVLTIDLTTPSHSNIVAGDTAPEAELWQALVLGTRDYVRKTGFTKAHLGLSGGIDSALVATVAAEALGKENVWGVLMPSPYSSQGSLDDSLALARNLGIHTVILPIHPIMADFDNVLSDAFTGYPPDITEENIQARIRGTLLMALSNKYGSLLLTTGNKSEISVGYCTLYGDMCGALAVIGDVPKVMVYRLAQWINSQKHTPRIPKAILSKAPSAELRPEQKDQDSLPPYDLLDEILHHHIELHKSPEEIIKMGFPQDIVMKILRLVKIAEFKRKQGAPCIKVTDRAFGTGWRMPIASKEWYLI